MFIHLKDNKKTPNLIPRAIPHQISFRAPFLTKSHSARHSSPNLIPRAIPHQISFRAPFLTKSQVCRYADLAPEIWGMSS
jgi:hypothetical protein